METKLNIAEILKNKPKGTKLYTDTFGELSIEDVYTGNEFGITLLCKDGNNLSFYNDGKYSTYGEPILVPSKEMQDWSKFAWKKGDILVSRDKNIHLIFEKFIDDTYTIFAGEHCYEKNYRNEYNYERRFDSFKTEYFTLETGDAAQKYLKTIEEKLGDKLNRETLEIEKTQPEFKDGDILSCDEDSYTRHTTLILHKDENITESIVSLVRRKQLVETNVPIDNFLLSRLYPAREDEKKELFDALTKKDKAWDAEKKQIVDLKPKCKFKPFDKVLVRDRKSDKWRVNLYGYKSSDGPYYCVYANWNYCIPYEDNEHLLGTTKNVED